MHLWPACGPVDCGVSGHTFTRPEYPLHSRASVSMLWAGGSRPCPLLADAWGKSRNQLFGATHACLGRSTKQLSSMPQHCDRHGLSPSASSLHGSMAQQQHGPLGAARSLLRSSLQHVYTKYAVYIIHPPLDRRQLRQLHCRHPPVDVHEPMRRPHTTTPF
jgi:hypothetical protein